MVRRPWSVLVLAQHGVGARRVRGMGHHGRVADDATPAGRHRNRRVEAWIRPVVPAQVRRVASALER